MSKNLRTAFFLTLFLKSRSYLVVNYPKMIEIFLYSEILTSSDIANDRQYPMSQLVKRF